MIILPRLYPTEMAIKGYIRSSNSLASATQMPNFPPEFPENIMWKTWFILRHDTTVLISFLSNEGGFPKTEINDKSHWLNVIAASLDEGIMMPNKLSAGSFELIFMKRVFIIMLVAVIQDLMLMLENQDLLFSLGC